jgi:hypothetical protein
MVMKTFDDGFIFVLTASVRFSYIRDKNQFKKKQAKKLQLGVTNETETANTCFRGIRVVQSLVFCVVFFTGSSLCAGKPVIYVNHFCLILIFN